LNPEAKTWGGKKKRGPKTPGNEAPGKTTQTKGGVLGRKGEILRNAIVNPNGLRGPEATSSRKRCDNTGAQVG